MTDLEANRRGRGTRFTLAALAALGVAVLAWTVLDRDAPPERPAGAAAPASPAGAPALPTRASDALRPGDEAVYELSWAGLPAASLTVRVLTPPADAPTALRVGYRFRTAPALDALWTCRAGGRAVLNAQSLRPVRTQHWSLVGERQKRTTVEFDHDAALAHVTQRDTDEPAPEQETVPFRPGMCAVGLWLEFARLDIATAEARHYAVFSGDEAYEMELSPEGTGPVQTPLGVFEARRYGLITRKADRDPDDEASHAAAEVGVESGLLLRLDGATAVGKVSAILSGFRRDVADGDWSDPPAWPGQGADAP